MGEGGRTGTNEKDDNRLPVVGDLITGSRECVNERGEEEEGLRGESRGIRVTFRKGGNGNVWDNPHLDDILLTVGSRRKNV